MQPFPHRTSTFQRASGSPIRLLFAADFPSVSFRVTCPTQRDPTGSLCCIGGHPCPERFTAQRPRMVYLEYGMFPTILAQTIGSTDCCQTRLQTSPCDPIRHREGHVIATPDGRFGHIPNTARLGRDNIQNELVATDFHCEGL